MQQIRKTTQRVDCSGLPQTCSNTPDVQTRNQKCMFRFLFRIRILQVPALAVILLRKFKSMRRKHIFSLLDCRQCNGLMHGLRMTIDSPVNDWCLNFNSFAIGFNNRSSSRYPQRLWN